MTFWWGAISHEEIGQRKRRNLTTGLKVFDDGDL